MRARFAGGLALILAVAAVAFLPATRADKPAPAAAEAWFVDDDEMYDAFAEKLETLAAAGKCMPTADLVKAIAAEPTCQIAPAKPNAAKLDAEDVYAAALPSVFLIGSVAKQKDKDGNDEFVDGVLGTAWVLAADGVLVTNWHLFDGLKEREFFGAMNHEKRVFPVTAVLAANKAADIAVIRIDAKGLTPLPLAEKPPAVGAWVGVLGHPGDRYFTFTQGHVARFTKTKDEAGTTSRWIAVTADYAAGSSGSPVLDRRGAVVGMAALTESLESGVEPGPEPKADDKKADEKKPEPAPALGSLQQMVVKLAVPASAIRTAVGAK